MVGNPEHGEEAAKMGWEKRGTQMYYFRRVRVAGKARSCYLGRGPGARLAADLEALQRRRRELEREAQRVEKQRWREADTCLLLLTELARLLVKATLRELGYHLHARSEWRRRQRGETPMAGTSTLSNLSPQESERLRTLLAQAQQGDRSVAGQLQEALDAHPDIWQRYGNIANQALATWTALTAGKDLVLEESLKRTLEALREELAEGAEPTPLERLLIERIVVGWLQVNHADSMVAAARTNSISIHAALTKRQESSLRRLVQAIRELAVLRKLTRRALSPMDIAMKSVPETSSPLPFGRATNKKGVPIEN